jgi:acyl-CoA thioesterase-1
MKTYFSARILMVALSWMATAMAASDAPTGPGLPRVLLLGDSISIGYTAPVQARLRGIADVRHGGEKRFDSGYALAHLDAWLGSTEWTVIHFNYGLWDIKFVDQNGDDYTVAEGRQIGSLGSYQKNLRGIVTRLKRTGAKLIFATTTPVPAGTPSRIKDTELPLNNFAMRLMRENSIPIDDLHAYVLPKQAQLQLPRNVHFTDAGYEALADAVAASIQAALSAR